MEVLALWALTSHLSWHLRGGVEVYCTSRSFHQNKKNLKYLQGNATDLAFLSKVLKLHHWDAIVNFMAYSTQVFRQLYEKFLNATDQYVFLSSSRVYASSEEPITEDSPRLLDVCKDADYLVTDEYALAKARQENILFNSGRKNWTIIRPYVTFSDYRLQLSCEEKESWLYRCLHGRTIVFSKDLASKITTFTLGEDVARGMAAVIGSKEALGEAFHITNPQSYTWQEISTWYLDAISKETGTRPKIYMAEYYRPYFGGNMPQVKYDRLYNRKFDNSKIGQFIDVSTFKPTHKALEDCIHNFIANPRFGNINWIHEALKDKLVGEWASPKEILTIKGKKTKAKYLLTRLGLYHPKL